MTSTKTTLLPPPAWLSDDVECFGVIEAIDVPEHRINVASAGLPGIVFQHLNGHSAIDQIAVRSGTAMPPTLFLNGASLDRSVMTFSAGSYTTTHITLKPQAVQTLFGLNALALTDDWTDLSEFGGATLNERLLETSDPQARLCLLVDFLTCRLEQMKARDLLVEESLRLIARNFATVTVRSLLESLNLSERQFERRFSQVVGLTPNAFIRIRRFNKALRLIRSGQYQSLTDIAHALHFYDQSHFIREIKAFSGFTPKDLWRVSQSTLPPSVRETAEHPLPVAH